MPPQKTVSFTVKANGILKVLKTDAAICPAFDPQKSKDRPPQKKFKAIWDTGATNSAITQKVVDVCGLKPIGVTKAHTAAGARQTNVYLVNIGFPHGVAFIGWKVSQVDLIGDSDVLIGMDIISKGDFAITNKDDKTTFTFRCPSIVEIDFVQEAKDKTAA